MIPFNKPYITGKESHYMYKSVYDGHISGNGRFTKKVQTFFEEKWGFKKFILTTSCTDALEMVALLLEIKESDEIIVPSYTFVSTALAFVRQGAKIIFADSHADRPGIDEDKIEPLITNKTKAIVLVHYAGVACDMDKVMILAEKYNLFVVEDAAQAVDSYYNGNALGGIGHFGTFSFHETKNIQSGEGGMLVINDERFVKRAEIIWEKGTNRAEFFRGEVDKYSWVDIGSSFLPADYVAGFLYAQLESIEIIQNKRKILWDRYHSGLRGLSEISLPVIPEFSTNNAHMYYIICKDNTKRDSLIKYLKSKGIHAVFHYLSLHQSAYSELRGFNTASLVNSDFFTNNLVRLPLYFELSFEQQDYIINTIKSFFYQNNL